MKELNFNELYLSTNRFKVWDNINKEYITQGEVYHKFGKLPTKWEK